MRENPENSRPYLPLSVKYIIMRNMYTLRTTGMAERG